MKSKAGSLSNIIIAGPCSAETRDQVLYSAKELKERRVKAMRACLWKPRTKPGFDGVGQEGMKWLTEAAETTNMAMCTEVVIPDHITQIAEQIKDLKETPKLILWLGARNQNHLVQREIAKRMAELLPSDTTLMIKNQPWIDAQHWIGIVEHVIAVGFPKEKILLCHRGFAVNKRDNAHSYRNIPDHEEAMYVKEMTNLPMLLDPSHIGGSIENVMKVTKEAMKYAYDGLVIEVHPNPAEAKTDAKQQLSLKQFDAILDMVRGEHHTYVTE